MLAVSSWRRVAAIFKQLIVNDIFYSVEAGLQRERAAGTRLLAVPVVVFPLGSGIARSAGRDVSGRGLDAFLSGGLDPVALPAERGESAGISAGRSRDIEFDP